jgi:oligoribonuclease
MKSDDNLIWLDLEMTGLDPQSDKILEIAIVITDKNLNILDKTESIAIYQTEMILSQMNTWCIKQHGKSGLTQRVKESNITLHKAEQICLNLIKKWVDADKSPMCGNSICQDRRFLARYMPKLEAYFHYRHIDVSTLKELAKRWQPEAEKKLTKDSFHLALDDIIDSINELKHYRQSFIKV